MKEIIEIVSELYRSDKVAFIALVISIIVGIYSWCSQKMYERENKKKERRQEEFQNKSQNEIEKFHRFQERFAQYERDTNNFQFSVKNQSELKPHFNINRTKSTISYDNRQRLVINLALTNIGRAAATNIQIKPIDDDNGNETSYLKNEFENKRTHGIYDYFSEYFAIPNESIVIKFSEIENNKEQLYFLIFKIEFQDIMGRVYEQKFRFGYDNQYVNGINQNSTSFPPELVKDIGNKGELK